MSTFYAKQFGGIFGGGGGGGSPTFRQEAPAGTIDGANVTFTLAQIPSANVNVMLFLDGGIQYQGIGLDYTLSSQTITMAVAPVANQTLWAFYS